MRNIAVTIHIVEDDPGVSDSLMVLLSNMGHDTIAYPDAESFFRNAPPASGDTIIVDLLLPGISGVGVIRWLQELKAPPRIVAITGQPQGAIENQLRGLSVPDVVRKPLSETSIARLV